MNPFQHLDQLPRGDDRAVGAGYAMAIAAGVGAILYFVVQGFGTLVLARVAGGDSMGLFLVFAALGLVTGAATLAGTVAPLGFVAGVVAWRVVPPSVPLAGAVSGFVATVLAYVGPGMIGVGGAVVLAVTTGGSVVQALVSTAAFVGFAFAFTCWITLPTGVVVGALYERSNAIEE